ncbi:GFA family protein [Mesorhizobium sp. ANAO-SY3R2]|uniref:GFA family protein n=1 Tax=Mesorhizobium sp. ANAO-SY3R2 TaxID=3166644 RepID=UPI003670D54C
MQDHVAAPVRSGSCLCRGVTFRVRGNPLRVGICHCTDCRKSSGAPFAAYAVWRIDAFEQETGYTSTYANRTLVCPLKSGPPLCMAFEPMEDLGNGQEETQRGRDRHEAAAG